MLFIENAQNVSLKELLNFKHAHLCFFIIRKQEVPKGLLESEREKMMKNNE